MENLRKRCTRIVAAVACLALLLVGQPMWTGTFDSPSGSPPHGFAYSGDASGQQFTGTYSIIFSGYRSDLTATAFDLVMRLRKGNELHNFYFADSCSTNTCGICVPDPSVPGGGLVYDLTLVSLLQQCVESGISASVKQGFGLNPTASVRLKSTSNYRGEPGPTGSELFLVVSDVELTAK